jgi:hypothetical protein
MYSNEDIDAAVKAGVLSHESARAFRSFAESQRVGSHVDEEHLRLVSGFNDIFIVIAGLLLLVATYQITKELVATWASGVIPAVFAWFLAEYFVRKQRMSLPGIVFLCAFVAGLFFTGSFVVTALDETLKSKGLVVNGLESTFGTGSRSSLMIMLSALLAAVGTGLHWMRFKVPLAPAMGLGALLILIIFSINYFIPVADQYFTYYVLVGGVIAFALAMYWDRQDPSRMSRQSDTAFWLHLLAAPALVHPIFSMVHVFDGEVTTLKVYAVITLYIVMGIVSLAIDRRALMVSSLIYVIYTFSTVFKNLSTISLGFSYASLFIGFGLLLLSVFWHPCRRFIFRAIPKSIQSYLAPL